MDFPIKTCRLCGRPLDVEGLTPSVNCGGDCLSCMAECGDPDAIEAMNEFNAALGYPTMLPAPKTETP